MLLLVGLRRVQLQYRDKVRRRTGTELYDALHVIFLNNVSAILT